MVNKSQAAFEDLELQAASTVPTHFRKMDSVFGNVVYAAALRVITPSSSSGHFTICGCWDPRAVSMQQRRYSTFRPRVQGVLPEHRDAVEIGE